LHQVGDLFELNVKLRCQKVKSNNRSMLCFDCIQLHATQHAAEYSQNITYFDYCS